MSVKEKISLNLGCHDRVIPGFKGMDREQYGNVDYVGDVSDLSRFPDGSVADIYASHILEHFPHTDTDDVLGEWYRVLEDGGALMVAVPDVEAVFEICAEFGFNDWARNFLWGDQEYEGAFHYTGFSEDTLRNHLAVAGFKKVDRVQYFGISKSDCSNLKLEGRPVSLNMVAVK